MKPRSIILLSGGLDSTVSAAIAAKRTRPLFALTIDYGQRAAKMEILAAKRICRELKIRQKVIELPFFKEFRKCHLIEAQTSRANKLSRKDLVARFIVHSNHPNSISFLPDESGNYKKVRIASKKFIRLKDIWVPNRNALFINVAACFAEYYEAELIVTGFNREEAQEFPDNTPEFIRTINKSLTLSTLKRVRVVSYVADHTKKEIYRIGLKYKAPLHFIYSCYLGGKKMCGRCASCKRLIACIG